MKTNFKKQALSLVLSLAMVVGVGVTTFASGPKPGVPQPAVEKPKELKIKKVLTLPTEGVKTPQQTFTFTFTPQSFDGDTTKTTECPAINQATVDYTNNDGKDEQNKKYDDDATKNGKQVIKLTNDALANVSFSKSGQYTYTVKETAITENDANKIWNSSKAEYLISLFVKKEGTKFIVWNIEIKQTKNDDGTENTTDAKKEYEPGKPEDKYKGNGLAFNNDYEEKAGNNNPSGTTPTDDDKKGLVVDKKIDNATAEEKKLQFEFKLTVIKDSAADNTKNTTFDYYVVDQNGQKGNKQTGTYGETGNTVKLKAGERIVLDGVLLGSTAKIEETDAQGYTPTITGKQTVVDTLKNTGIILSDDKDNGITFTNKIDKKVGFILNNLPFIVLVAFAGFGILFFVKNKKEKDEEEQRA